MKTLPITIFFLLLMALLAYGSLNTGVDKLVELRAVQGGLEVQRAIHNGREQTQYLTEKGKRLSRGTRPPKPRVEVSRHKKPPKKQAPIVHPTKLNLAQGMKRSVQGKLYREVCEKLIHQLYHDYPPFQQVPDAESELMERLADAAKGQQITLPEHLATLDLGDLQSLWQQLLMGDDCPSLLDYVYYKPKPKSTPSINTTWAPEPLLQILLGGSQIESLLELQKELAECELEDREWGEILEEYKEKARLEHSPYQRILRCQLPSKQESVALKAQDVEGRAEGEGGPSQMKASSHMLLE